MAITIDAFESSETIGTTEHSLTTDTSGPDADTTVGIFQTFVDLNDLAAGDVFELSAYEKVVTGGTQRKVYTATFSGPQTSNPVHVTPALALGVGWDFTLKKISGTDRSISWRIVQVA